MIEVSPATFERLQKHARPLVDTVDTVIIRLLDFAERQGPQRATSDPADASAPNDVKLFSAANPPSLTHTRVISAYIDDDIVERADTNWNGLLLFTIRHSHPRLRTKEELGRLLLANFVYGRKEDMGYRHLPYAGVSVQGQDANAAWRATFHLLSQLEIPYDVTFAWQNKEEAAHPGMIGRFRSEDYV